MGINTFQPSLSSLTLIGGAVPMYKRNQPASNLILAGSTILTHYLLSSQQVHWLKDNTSNPTRVLFTINVPFTPSAHVPAVHKYMHREHLSITLGMRWCPQLLDSTPVSRSVTTAAVRPTPEEPRPLALTDTSARCMAALSNWDLATPGSPTNKQCMSPLTCIPHVKFRSRPPSS